MPKKITNQLNIIERVDKLLAQSESEVDELLATRLKEILSTLSVMYNKFVIDDKTSYTDLNKYNRLSKELERISEQMNEDYKQIVKMIEHSTQRIYIEKYLMMAYLFEVYQSTDEENIGVHGFSIPSEEVVAAALVNPIEFLTLPNVFKQHRNEIIRKLHIEIASSLLSGEGFDKMAQRIEKAIGFSRNKARTVARTEGSRAMAMADRATEEELKKYAKVQKVWLASLDHKTRTAHRKLDGQRAKDSLFHYKGLKAPGPCQWHVASMDINCRCTVIYLVNGQFPSVRRGRDYTDKTYQGRLQERIEMHIQSGDTYAQAYKKADKEVLPPSTTMPYVTFDDWRKKYS